MKRLIYNTSLLLTALALQILFASFKHPVKMTNTEIDYIHNEKKIIMVCSFFADDFKKAIKQDVGSEINITKPSQEEITTLNKYLANYIKLSVNSKDKVFSCTSTYYDASANLFKMFFEYKNVILNKGSALTFENGVLFNHFGSIQVNYAYLSLAPFVMQESLAFNIENYSKTYILK